MELNFVKNIIISEKKMTRNSRRRNLIQKTGNEMKKDLKYAQMTEFLMYTLKMYTIIRGRTFK